MTPSFPWKRRFLARHARGELVFEGLNQPHPTRGWALRPNLSEQRGAIRYTSNAHGGRSLREFVDRPGTYQVIVLGDSFTFGDEIDDTQTWPHLLQRRDGRLNVFNMAGTAYGVDQMYLTLAEAADEFTPDLVIAAYITDDLRRSLLDFRDYKKPRFVLEQGELVLTNVPIGDVTEVVEELRRLPLDRRTDIQLLNVARSVLDRWKAFLERGSAAREGHLLNQKLVEEMNAIAERGGGDFLLVYLPWGEEITDPAARRGGEDFFDRYRASHDRGHFLNPRDEFLRAGFEKSDGHYREAENRLLSSLVLREIQTLPSWRRFLAEGAEAR